METIKFRVKTSSGQEFETFAENLTKAEEQVICEIGTEEGDYLEILGNTKIHRITRREAAEHWNHPGYIFNSFDIMDAINRDISLFKLR